MTSEAHSFKYDPFGRRIYKSSSTATSIYAYDGDNLIEETNSSGAVVARYEPTQNIDEPLAMLRSGATSYFHADGLGSITSLSNAAGSIANTYTYDSFGKLTASTGSLVNPFQYTARESDSETGLYYYRARYYDPSAGRFLSQDPIGFRGGLNLYSYTRNRPTGSIDPRGTCVTGTIDTAICVLVAVGAVELYFGVVNYSIRMDDLVNLAYNHHAATQNALNKCLSIGSPRGASPEACQEAIDLAAETECALLKGAQRAGFAGMTLPGTVVGGDIPGGKLDLAAGVVTDQISKEAERMMSQAEKKSEKKGCGCHK